MKTAIIYYSKHGTTEKVAHLIGDNLDDELTYISLKKHRNPDIRIYNKVILGTSIYAGSPGKVMTQFCNKNRILLEKKVIGLFICCMNREQEKEEITNAFPKYLHKVAITEAILGGEFLFEKMNFIERFITKRITKTHSSVSSLRQEAIKEFVTQITQQ
ncbi:flavodoxin domain-containing protein [Bacteroides sp.]